MRGLRLNKARLSRSAPGQAALCRPWFAGRSGEPSPQLLPVVASVQGTGRFSQGHVLSFSVVQVLLAAAAMLFMVMPNYLVLPLYLVLLLSHRALSQAISIPGPPDPRFVVWGGTLAVVLVFVFAWCWRQLLRGDMLIHP